VVLVRVGRLWVWLRLDRVSRSKPVAEFNSPLLSVEDGVSHIDELQPAQPSLTSG
jgi:hypothetical protein